MEMYQIIWDTWRSKEIIDLFWLQNKKSLFFQVFKRGGNLLVPHDSIQIDP